ncbi:T9SS type A sorting domain-containing protein [Taibaiella soli]|uniref:BIG2 domain-containing protein n=1 Tax=Taibaiella soli TaxID=1649169 RepID=A0A2W2BCP5_9BACT|nr:T9SS type A sorting domain-containing protein [Taibaiella soli]PZF73999.1 hypothetical protein DN068_05240 [Taibaiella soli]
MKKLYLALGLLSGAATLHAQTNSIDISSAQQTNPASGKWKVIAMSADMQNAYCYGNTNGPAAPQSGATAVSPVIIGQDALVLTNDIVDWSPNGGTFLSCFQYNTVYTSQPSVKNNTNCTMTIQRRFYVCSDTAQLININLPAVCDDYILSATMDGSTVLFTNTSSNPSFPSAVTINSTQYVTPGPHTIEVVCANNEDPVPNYYYVGGAMRQWNPFGVMLTGNITTAAGNILYDTIPPAMPVIIGNPTITSGQSATLSNAAGNGTWFSSNTAVATVSQTGVITAINAGTTVISYTNSHYCPNQTSKTITVENPAGINTPIATGNTQLLQNAPNPFNGKTIIEYFVTTIKSGACICVYDLNGKELQRLPIASAGKGSVVINDDLMPSGIYLYSLIIDGQKIGTRRMTLIK